MILAPPALSPNPQRSAIASALAAVIALVGARAATANPGPACPENPSVAVARAFRASTWVVRARFTGADDHWGAAGESWTVLHAQILQAYKGHPPLRLDILTRGDDAGTWLNRGSLSEVGQEYLLFLRPSPPGVPVAGAAEVSDRCGESKPWPRVSHEEARSLESPLGPAVLPARSLFRSRAGTHHFHGEVLHASHRQSHHRWRWPAPLRALFNPRAAGDV